MTFLFRIVFTLWLGHFISRYLKVHFMLIRFNIANMRMRYPFQSTSRLISHRNLWSFRFFMIPLRDFVREWNSRPVTTTGVNSRRGDLRRHDILWWYHVNKCRAMRGNRSELTPEKKSPRCHVNTPLKVMVPMSPAVVPNVTRSCSWCYPQLFLMLPAVVPYVTRSCS